MPDTEETPAETPAEETPAEEKKPEGPAEYIGAAKGKYNWDEPKGKKDADSDMGAAITKYGWSDGKKTVSIYVELEGLDDVPEDQLSSTSTESEATLTIAAIGKPPVKRTLALKGLCDEITGAKVTQKKGKSTVVLKLTKKEEKPWYKLLSSSGGGGGGDDEDDMGGMGGMGGMPGMGGMGGMGGMDMASMMGGMGGMGGMGMM